jgi:hypothetical protein
LVKIKYFTLDWKKMIAHINSLKYFIAIFLLSITGFVFLLLINSCDKSVDPENKTELPNGHYASIYSGTFSGSDNGPWIVIVDNFNQCSGKGTSAEDGDFNITGTVSNTGGINLVAGDASVGATFSGQILEDGTVSGSWKNENFGYTGTFSGIKFNIIVGSIDRVSIYNKTLQNNEQTFQVNIPATVPNGFSATLRLLCTNGVGEARFNNDSLTIQISQSRFLSIRGKKNSDVKNNIILQCQAYGRTVNLDSFSVRTWPTGFRMQVPPKELDPPNEGTIQYWYEWDSESGDTRDLYGIYIGEWVDYPGQTSENRYYYSSPPYRNLLGDRYYVDDPHMWIDTIGVSTQKINNVSHVVWNWFQDTHLIPTTDVTNLNAGNLNIAFDNSRPYQPDTIKATQYYWMRDPLLNPLQYDFTVFPGTYHIIRYVFFDSQNNIWKYRIEKDDFQGERELP